MTRSDLFSTSPSSHHSTFLLREHNPYCKHPFWTLKDLQKRQTS